MPARIALIILIALGGAIASVTSFGVTSTHGVIATLGGPTVDVEDAGFDLWTGEPHGRSYRIDPQFDPAAMSGRIQEPVPEDIVGRRAIPLPISFVIGSLGTGVIATSASRWNRRGKDGRGGRI